MPHIVIKSGSVTIRAEMLDTPTARAIHKQLPLEGEARTWGEEVYFLVPVEAAVESEATDVVSAGEIAYWPEGPAIAIGFGPTPISHGNEIRLASPCNIWAKAIDSVRTLKDVAPGDVITVEED